jgi:hypothetical protein
MSAPLKPLANQSADEACTRTVACNAVQGFDLLWEQAYLDCDPAFFARTFSRKLRLVSFGHGKPQETAAPEGAAKLDQFAGAGAFPSCIPQIGAGIIVELKHAARLSLKRFQHYHVGVAEIVRGANPGAVFRRVVPALHFCKVRLTKLVRKQGCELVCDPFNLRSHFNLHCSDHANIWGPHMPVNGVPITIFTMAAQEAAA